jgi:excisionase family DNA binding protein
VETLSASGTLARKIFRKRKASGENFPQSASSRKRLSAHAAPSPIKRPFFMSQPVEISPEDAATLLGVHPRTIRNLIKRQQVKATKVSGRWYIDKASVEAARDSRIVATTHPAPSTVVNAPTPQRGPRALAPYRLSCHAFEQFNWTLDIPEATALRVGQLKLAVLEHFGAGFYSYGHEKRHRYIAARSALGAIVGLLDPYQSQADVGRIVSFLETECIGATASLIRKIEREKDRKKDPPRD